MPSDRIVSLKQLSDDELEARMKSLAARERGDTAELIAHLAELDTRDLHLRSGHGSLFAYCRDALHLSEHEAYNRMEAARAARRFPVVLDLLVEGAVNLTTVRLLAPHLTADNHQEVLESARGKRKSAVEVLVARLAPWPDVPPSLRRLPTPRLSPSPPAASPGVAYTSAPSPVFRPAPPATVPLAEDRYKVQFTIGAATVEKLRLAKDMLRHAIPSGDEALLFDRALTVLLAELAKRKFAATDHPRPSGGTAPGSRHIPAEVKRAVWLRDLGVCAFVGTNGRRCTGRAFLEFHHVRPYAAGGEPTVSNVQLRCRSHNGYEARTFFDRGDSLRKESAPR